MTSSTGSGGHRGTGGSGSGTTSTPIQGMFAAGIKVTDVEVNQGVGIAVVTAGALVSPSDRTAPIIGQRHGMVRVSWALDTGFAPRDIEARVTLTDSQGKSTLLQQTKTVSGPPDPTQLDGTFHWDVDGSMIDGGTTFSVELHETSGSGNAQPGAARFPQSGAANLGALGDPMKLKVVIAACRRHGLLRSRTPRRSTRLRSGPSSTASSGTLYPLNGLEVTYHAQVTLQRLGLLGDEVAIADAISAMRDADVKSGAVGDDGTITRSSPTRAPILTAPAVIRGWSRTPASGAIGRGTRSTSRASR